MRGESKYHYVDLALIDDPIEGQSGELIMDGASVGAAESFASRR